MNLQELQQAAAHWLAQDPDAETRAELTRLIESADEAGLRARFETRIGFGTAGLRGELGAGPNRMNRVLVAQAAAGIARQMLETGGKSVVIGFDGRINSDVFARDSAEIFAGAGLEVFLFDGFVPTPLLAFATRRGPLSGPNAGRPFDIGVMVTASHNPPRDNGYKVYAGSLGGSQIISPIDKQIAAHIDEVAATLTFAELPKSSCYTVGGAEYAAEYVSHTATLVAAADERLHPAITFTAMHGVGWETTRAVFAAAGIPEPTVVSQQIAPDGNFPTVAFPNPEEPGALDLASQTASASGSQLILAVDPDADRLAVAVPDESASLGWRKLTGDQIGFLLGATVAERAAAAGITGNLACSIASSRALARVAEANGLGFTQTLTGFKWISKVPDLLFGYEEALGYCLDPQATPDKDGISAAVVVADLAARLAARGQTIDDRMAELYASYGHWATSQITLRFDNVAKAAAIVARIRATPPMSLLGETPGFTDLAHGTEQLPPTDGLMFEFADGRHALIRPSGTEPKLKCYLEATGQSKQDASAKLSELEAAFREVLA
ncbi:MAG: phospho-sugar mutase [Micrococcales bacterium]